MTHDGASPPRSSAPIDPLLGAGHRREPTTPRPPSRFVERRPLAVLSVLALVIATFVTVTQFRDSTAGPAYPQAGPSSTPITSEVKISDATPSLTASIDGDDRFGEDVTAIGDLDGDGINDIAIGARNDDDEGTDRGAVYVVFLNADGTVKGHNKISDSSVDFAVTLDDGDNFGRSVAGLGDLDGDGIGDIAVGATGDDDGPGTDRGALYILFLNTNGTVKTHQKISDTDGNFTGVLDDGDDFGKPVSSIGDLDGDGTTDIAVGATGDDDGGIDRGALYILFLNTNGTVKTHQKISDTDGNFTAALDDNDWFGEAVADLGDIDGDGVTDIAVGAPGDDDGGIDRGAAYILFLNANGTVKSHQKISDTDGNFTAVLEDDDYFGFSIASVGDIDDDGTNDIAVGAILDDDGGTGRGAIYLVTLNTDGSVKADRKISDTQGGLTTALDDDDWFGDSIAGLGDLDGDGAVDLAVGAPFDDDGVADAGAVYIIDLTPLTDSDGDGLWDRAEDANTDADDDPATNPGPDTDGDTTPDYLDADDDGDGTPTASENADPNTDGYPSDAQDSDHDGQPNYLDTEAGPSTTPITTEQKISAITGGLTGPLGSYDSFGSAVAGLGDLDGDGINDIAVGAWADNDGGSDSGAIYILFLNADGTVKAEQKVSATTGGLAGPLDDFDYFGASIGAIGDLNRDGVPDLIVGAPLDDDGSGNAGAAYILFLNADGTVKTEQKISATTGGLTGPLDNSDQFGLSVTSIGDIDGDGTPDIAIGAEFDDDGGTDSGAAYILTLNTDGTVKAEQKISATTGGLTGPLEADDNFGREIRGIGDIDGDGTPDLAIATIGDDDGASNAGAAYIVFLNADGTVKAEQKISATTGGFAATLDADDRFGKGIAALGDLNGDGTPDIAIGAESDDDGGTNRGAIYILTLNADGTVQDEQKISASTGGLTGPLDNVDYFGFSLASLGDLDNDGALNLAVGALYDDDGGFDLGAVYILDLTSLTDSDGDGLWDRSEDANTDVDNDPATNPGPDTDGDTTPDYLDADDDGDGTPTASENADPNGDGEPRDAVDSDFDGQPDYRDANEAGVSTLPVVSEQQIAQGIGGLAATLDNYDYFGTSMAGIGDLDGDGINDVAVGASRDEDGSADRGAVYILFLNANGTVKAEQKISAIAGGLTATLDSFDEFGTGIAGIGDLDGDGVNDIAVGAPRDDDGTTDSGAVYILFLNTNGTVKAHQKISNSQGGLPFGINSFDRFGTDVTAIGDLDGDGTNDIAVGSPRRADGGSGQGAIHVLFLNDDGTVRAGQTISDTAGSLATALDVGDEFGTSVAGVGDLDGDGTPDLVVGARNDDDGNFNAGAVYVLFLNPDGTVGGEQKISALAGGFSGPLASSDNFGIAVAAVGDLDNDGNTDVAVGLDGDSGYRGAVWLLTLSSSGTVTTEQKIANGTGGFSGPLDASDRFGTGVTSLGDLDGDGAIDLAIGAPRTDLGSGTDPGAAYLIDLTAIPTANVVSGTVEEDVDGDGDVADDGTGRSGVDVWLFADADGDGEPSAGDIVADTTITDGTGAFSLEATDGDGTYWVAVAARDVSPSAGYHPAGSIDDVFAEQTYGPAGAATFDGSTWSFAGSAGSAFGGATGNGTDGFPTLAASEHIARVIVAGSDVTGLGFGFSFTPITNTLDEVLPTGLTDTSAWSAYDPGTNGVGTDPDGYHGAVFDGRFVYYVPLDNGVATHSEVLRYDTTADFASAGAWATFDPSGAGVNAETGYVGGVFDGRYVYFVPAYDTVSAHGEVLRYDTTAGFTAAGSWTAYDPGSNGVGTDPDGYSGATFDGRYLYFSPWWNGTQMHGEALRYDTTASFTTASSWTSYDPGANGVGAGADGYRGAVFDGDYVYFVPDSNSGGPHGEVLRYDPSSDFSTAGSWTTFDPGANGVGTIGDGYLDGVFDGRYLYLVPNADGAVHGEVLRYDTTASFGAAGSWEAYDPGAAGVGSAADGFWGAEFDGRYLYFVPNQAGEVLVYDTASTFSSASSWAAYDPGTNGVGTDPDGYSGAVFDGRYLHFAPAFNGTDDHGEVLRYDTQQAGQGSFRRFVENSNAVAGVQTTNFEIPTSDPGYVSGAHDYWSIQPTSNFPVMSQQVVLDGYTQPGATAGTTSFPAAPDFHLKIEFSGALAPGASLDPLQIIGSSSAVRGLVVNDFTGTGATGIEVSGGTGTVVEGNIVGADPTGTVARSGRYGIFATSNTTIGGPGAGQQNLVAGATNFPIYLSGGAPTVQGNFVGTDITGTTVLGSSTFAIYPNATTGVTIGGATAAEGNVVAGSAAGIYLSGAANSSVENNFVGTDVGETLNLGNAIGLLASTGASGHVTGNVIAYSTQDGVQALSTASISLLGNSISSSGELAIDFNDDEVTANDANDADTGPNDLLNFPVVTATSGGLASFSLDVPAGDYVIEAFRNPTGTDASGHGEAEVSLGTVQIAHTGSGSEQFNGSWPGLLDGGEFSLTTTECTDGTCTGYTQTSELSASFVPSSAVDVNSTADGGDANPGDQICSTGGTNSEGDTECTLRAAIEEANAGSVDAVSFAIPTSDANHTAGTWTITPATALPALATTVTIDGTTQAGYSTQPIVGLDGNATTADGFLVAAANVTISGLAIHGWSDDGVDTAGPSTTITSSWLGIDVNETPAANGQTDIQATSTATNLVVGGAGALGNRIAAAGADDGIALVSTSGATIEGNVFGMAADGTSYGAPAEAIVLSGTTSSTSITDNRFGRLPDAAIVMLTSGSGTTITGNVFGIAEDSSAAPVGEALYSTGSGAAVFGGTNPGDGNTVANATGAAVGSVANNVAVLGNSTFDNGGLGIDLSYDGVTANDAGDIDSGPNDLLNFPVLQSVSDGQTSISFDLDVPAGDYRIELFSNPSAGADPTGHGEGETLLASTTVTHPGGGSQSFTMSPIPAVSTNDVLSATATLDTGGGTYTITSEFSAAVTVVNGGSATDRGQARHDMVATAGLDTALSGAGLVADSIAFGGSGQRLQGSASQPASTAFTASGWVNASTLSGDSAIVAQSAPGTGLVYELIVDGGTGEAVASLRVGGSTIEARGGTIGTAAWHQVAATYDGADLVLYVDGAEVDRTAAAGSITTDVSIPVTVGNTSTGVDPLVGQLDQVTVASAVRSAAWIQTEYLNLTDPGGMVVVGAEQTSAPGSWSTTTDVVRNGSHALDAPTTTGGSDPWAVLTGIDEPGLAFEAWWYLTSPSTSSVAAGNNAGSSPTDQRETRANASGLDLASLDGATRTVDATDPATIPAGTWTQVEIRTDETGTSSVFIDGVQVIAPTAHSGGTSAGSAGLRVETLPGGQRWYVDDVQVRRLVSDEPTASLGPLIRQ